MRKNHNFVRPLLAVVLATVCGVSQAATISFDDTYGPVAVPSTTITVPLPKFDPTLGTLTKVTLTLDAETSAGTISWDNEAPVASDITLGIGAEVTATAPSALTAVAVPLQTDSGQTDADNDGAADFLGTDAFAVTGGSGSDSDMDMSTLPATLALYTATFLGETFDTTIDSAVETFLSTSGGFGPIDPVPGITEGMVTVTYEYVPIPEPATFTLAGIGCLALALLARRRRS